MRNIVKRILGRGSEDQKGFTLIELLIVVGIIVALAAVIIPLVIQFAGKGQEGAQAAEFDTVQTGIDAFMTDHNMIEAVPRAVLATALILGTETLFTLVTDDPHDPDHTLASYMRDLPTKCFYHWLANGTVTQDVTTVDVTNECGP